MGNGEQNKGLSSKNSASRSIGRSLCLALGKKAKTPDEMNTSYGPRIDVDRWDFHDGIDLPAPVGTPVHAMADGVVHRAGPADQVFSSTHVRLKVVDPIDGKNDLFLIYLHLDSVAEKMISGATVKQGDVIGAVGQEDATYPHLHFEFRKGKEPTRWSQPLAYGGWWAENSSPAS